MSNLDDKDLLTRELRDRSHDIDGHPLDFAGVKGRAVGIQRRRRVAGGVVAAVALAIVVPTALSVTGDLNRGGQPVEQPSPTISRGVDPSPGPVEADGPQFLDTRDLPEGAPAAMTYLADNTIVSPGSVPVDLGSTPRGEIVPFKDGWIVTGGGMASVLGADGEVLDQEPTNGGLAVSEDEIVAYVNAAGEIRVLWDSPDSPMTLTSPDAQTLGAVEVTGDPTTCAEGESPRSCTVWVNDLGGTAAAFLSSAQGFADVAGPWQLTNDISTDGWAAARVSTAVDGTCSAVFDDRSRQLWDTCDFRFEQFSPDGAHLLGTNAYGDGIGDTQLVIYDARSGNLVVDYSGRSEGTFTLVADMVWEDSTHVLAVTYQDGMWRVVRIGLDGSLETVDSVEGDETERKFFLSTRP